MQTVHFPTAIFPDSPPAQAPWQRSLWALAASLSLHLMVLAIVHPGAGSAGMPSASSATPAVAVTLPGPAGRESIEVARRPDYPLEVIEPVALDVTRGRGETAAASPPIEPPDLALNLLPRPHYFPRSELTIPPALQDEPSIDPPPESPGDTPTSGQVILRVFVGVSGAVDRIEVASSSLPVAYEVAAIAAFSRVRFRPGELEGVAVGSQLRFEIAFDVGEGATGDGPGMLVGRAPKVDGGIVPAYFPPGAEGRQENPLLSSSFSRQRQAR